MKITYHGHACFELSGSRRVLIDPFISGNPSARVKPEELEPEVLLVTHGHEDHLGDALDIAKRAKPEIGVIHELAVLFQEHGVEATGMNIYGSAELAGVRVTLLPALHSSSYAGRYTGSACGYLVEMDGRKVYHAGDTGLFGDMRLIGELFSPEVMLVPVGDRYTMSPELAVRAVEMVKPELVIPMHYRTFPVLAQSIGAFTEGAEKAGARVVVLEPGESHEL
ncbi:MAG: metal-dependent hydrolase [Euryarchaeota archaeon]|nr:metal-dependent hydrolase [Euryarchaeota archaeon]